jgi:type II secretory ATPase GspE/PulE/Tfp pilus assembly ATPase PilB-like protein
MTKTLEYLQSDFTTERGIEIGVLVNLLLADAIKAGAGDIHLEPWENTTAIYSALYHIVQRSGPAVSISTVEDPVEFNLPMISQAQINPAQEFTYAKALRSLMRQDPQVIMVGEIRDPETAQIAVQAGLTGHLVISTIQP